MSNGGEVIGHPGNLATQTICEIAIRILVIGCQIPGPVAVLRVKQHGFPKIEVTLSNSNLSAAPSPARRRPPKRRYALCEVTGKRRYRDGDDAGLVLRNLKRRGAAADVEGAGHTIRVERKYACDWCDGWHLTSWPGPHTPPAVLAQVAA